LILFQSDYLRKISLKMLTMESKSQSTLPNAMASNSTSKSPQDPGSSDLDIPQPIIGEIDPSPVSIPTLAPAAILAPLRTYARRVKQTIDKVIPTASHSPPMIPALDDLPIVLLKEALAHPEWKTAMNEEM
ncbi:hypothetical protein AKJ16_DCAP26096, partial [Drosera capensis]